MGNDMSKSNIPDENPKKEAFGSLQPNANVLQDIDFEKLDKEGLIKQNELISLFLAPLNKNKVSKMAFQYARGHGFNPIVKIFYDNVPILMEKWVKERSARRFSVDCGDTFDWYQTIEFMNRVFLDENRDYLVGRPEGDAALAIQFRKPASSYWELYPDLPVGSIPYGLNANVDSAITRNKVLTGLQVEVGTFNEYENTRKYKDYGDLLVEDYQQLDYWIPRQVYTWDRCPRKSFASNLGSSKNEQCFPCNNPKWQTGMKPLFPVQQDAGAYRPFDRSNDGLRDTAQHSERDTMLRPFDMKEIYKVM